MRIAGEPAFVLHARPWRETSLLVEALTANHGRLGLVARGVRGARRQPLRAALQPLQHVRLDAVQQGELAQLRNAEALDAAPLLAGEAVLAAFYVNELVLRLAPRNDPQHALFAALRRHDYPAFAAQQLKEREQAGMPPFASQALLRAEARTQETAQAFLRAAAELAAGSAAAGHVSVYSPVPMAVQRVANVERAQMLLESASRPALQHFLADWHPQLHGLKQPGLIRWAVDVDPLSV